VNAAWVLRWAGTMWSPLFDSGNRNHWWTHLPASNLQNWARGYSRRLKSCWPQLCGKRSQATISIWSHMFQYHCSANAIEVSWRWKFYSVVKALWRLGQLRSNDTTLSNYAACWGLKFGIFYPLQDEPRERGVHRHFGTVRIWSTDWHRDQCPRRQRCRPWAWFWFWRLIRKKAIMKRMRKLRNFLSAGRYLHFCWCSEGKAYQFCNLILSQYPNSSNCTIQCYPVTPRTAWVLNHCCLVHAVVIIRQCWSSSLLRYFVSLLRYWRTSWWTHWLLL